MKLKCQPADFQVQEICRLPLGGGEFAAYELAKQSLGTLEALDALAQRWRLPRQAIAFAGLKDKHAETRQTITIRRGPQRNLQQTNLQVRYLGQASRPVESGDIEGNEFRIVVRDLPSDAVQQALEAAPALICDGIPNYFDDQRFGSLGEAGEFIARPWCLGQWERTIWLIIAAESEHDSPDEREQKRLLRTHWGDWPMLVSTLPRFRWRSVLEYLANRPGDFRGALSRVPQDLRSLFLAAYQSHLWNGMLSALIEQQVDAGSRFAWSIGSRKVWFWKTLEPTSRDALSPSTLPLPSARLHDVDERTQHFVGQVLQPEGLELRQLRVKYPRDSFFSKGDRPVMIRPEQFALQPGDDELYSQRQRIELSFRLPRGAYATVVVKRLLFEQTAS